MDTAPLDGTPMLIWLADPTVGSSVSFNPEDLELVIAWWEGGKFRSDLTEVTIGDDGTGVPGERELAPLMWAPLPSGIARPAPTSVERAA